jgi:hypothetical protein
MGQKGHGQAWTRSLQIKHGLSINHAGLGSPLQEGFYLQEGQ